jgi:hypothetical protein
VSRKWSRGETVVLRHPPEDRTVRAYRAKSADFVLNVTGWPHVVLEDSVELTALYLPEGTPLWRWNIEEGRLREPRITRGDSVRLLYPGRRFEVTLFFNSGSGQGFPASVYFPKAPGPFFGWKVDLTSPFVRTAVGFDVFDDVLDIAVMPDRRWQWRDEDEMADLVTAGLYTEEEAAELRGVGEAVIEMVVGRLPPFDDSWQDWRPGADLKLGPLPSGWQHVPVAPPYRRYER